MRVITKPNSNKILVGHLPYNQGLSDGLFKNRVPSMLMVRDPRDVASSNVHYIQTIDRSHRLYRYFSEHLTSFEYRLSASICGVPSSRLNGGPLSMDIGWHIRRYLGWIDDERYLVIRFEDLIGVKGRGSLDRQYEVLNKIFNHLGVEKSSQEIAQV